MKDFNWLHFSDLHMWSEEKFESKYARKKLVEYLETMKLDCDYMFITGDIANKGDYSNTKQYVSGLIAAAKMDQKIDRVLWSIGNHDISRDDNQERLEYIRNVREHSGQFSNAIKSSKGHRCLIRDGMYDYFHHSEDIIKKIFSSDERTKPHFLFQTEDLSVVVLNTCLTSCDDDDTRKLFLSIDDVDQLLRQANRRTPIFVIGHHGKDFMHPSECEKLSRLFDDNVVDCYLCGHSHKVGYDIFTDAKNDVHQFTCGGGGPLDGYSQFTFMHGRFNAATKTISITPYSFFENGNGEWKENYSLHRRMHEKAHFNIRTNRMSCTVDDVLSSQEPYLDDYIANAKKDIFISTFFLSYFPTSKVLKEKIREGVSVRFLISKHNGVCTHATSIMLDGGNLKRYNNKLQSTLQEIYRCYGQGRMPENLSIREIDYTFPNRLTAIDLNEDDGLILVRLSAYKNLDAVQASFTCSKSDYWYSVYKLEIEALWNDATPLDIEAINSI